MAFQVLHAGMSEEELPQYDEKADIWSAGAVIYEALTGMQPFPAESAAEMQRLHVERLGGPCDASGVPLWLRGCTQLSPGAQEFLAQMLCLAPGKRLSAEQCLQHPWLHKHIRSSASQWLLPPEPAGLPPANNVVPLSPPHTLTGRISDEVSSGTPPAPVTQQLTGISEPRPSSIEVIVSSAPKKVAVR
jgi:serine/threonine protein kinase